MGCKILHIQFTFKYFFFCVLLFSTTYTVVCAQNPNSSANLDVKIGSYLERLENGGDLSDEQYEELGFSHYQRGSMYKSIYFYSLDAALKILKNRSSNLDSEINPQLIDFIKIRRESFLNNDDEIEEILNSNEDSELLKYWENMSFDDLEISSMNQIVAYWYGKNNAMDNCGDVNDPKLGFTCEYFFLNDLDLNKYLQLESNIRNEIPSDRDVLIDFSYEELVKLVDYYHAQWVYDFSVSHWFYKQVEHTRYIDALFQTRNWEALTSTNSNSGEEAIEIFLELGRDFQGTSKTIQDIMDEMLLLDSPLNIKNLRKWNFIIVNLTEGLSSKIIGEHLYKLNYPENLLEIIKNHRGIVGGYKVPNILLRTEIANAMLRTMAMYLLQSNSKRPEYYGHHKMVLSAHHNFLNRGIGGGNQAKAQLFELQKIYKNVSLLHFLVQQATDNQMGNENSTTITN